jgi:AraC family transcriptional regulator, transcriptional activator FtrA
MKGHLVAVLVHEPVSTFEFGSVADVFGNPRPEAGVEWYDFAVGGIAPGPVLSTGGIPIHVPHGLEIFERADTVILPCWDSEEDPPPEMLAVLRRAYERGARILSICSGAFALAAAGILDGRRATTHWIHAAELAQRYPKVTVEADVLYIDEGQVVTGAGCAAGLDMMLHVVRRDHGVKVCNFIARRMVIPPHREGGQAQFALRPVPNVPDSRFARVLEWMRDHANEEVSTEQLASLAAMSQRSFFRRFREATGMAPYDWIIRERIAIAKELLEDGRQSIERVATAAGFNAAETMRHHFRRIVGRTPAEYRRTFAGSEAVAEAA